MIIVLEGADNSGKSTLASKLGQYLSIDVVHPGGPPKNIVDVINRCQEQANVFQLSSEFNLIFDRITCISDLIYRGRPELDNIFGVYQKQLKSAVNVIIIYCRPSDERLRNFDDHVQKDHEDEAVVQYAKDNVNRVISEYDNLMRSLIIAKHFKVITYDFELDSDGQGFAQLVNYLNDKKDAV